MREERKASLKFFIGKKGKVRICALKGTHMWQPMSSNLATI
jgi:hypothetical protein